MFDSKSSKETKKEKTNRNKNKKSRMAEVKKHKTPIAEGDMNLLNRYFADCFRNSTKLQEFVWFNLCYHFGRRGREGWRALQKEHFEIMVDADGNCYVGAVLTESTKNNPGGQSCQDYSDVRMYEVVSNSMDPVKAFEFYLSKLHPENKNLFSKSKKIFSRDDIWFTKEVIGKNTLVNMMKNISNKAGLSKVYTNHCVRASTVTHLYQAGVDAHQICSITKHENESTLAHYISSTSDKQKRNTSHILSNVLAPGTC